MKKITHLLFAASSLLFIGVSTGADVCSPTSTERTENKPEAILAQKECGQHFTITKMSDLNYVDVSVLTLDKIWWETDEEFYRTGYTAKLSKHINEITKPPDSCAELIG